MRNGKLVVVELIAELSIRGGAETFFYDLVNEMSKRDNIELHVIVLWDAVLDSFASLKGAPNLHFYSLGKKRGVDFACAKKLRVLIEGIDPDIVNGHVNYLLTYLLAFVGRNKRHRLVHTIHNITEKGYNFFKRYFAKRKQIFFIGISKLVTERCKKEIKNPKITTINNGIKLRPFQDGMNKKWDFICVARFSEQKNHVFLIYSFFRYLQKYGDARLLCLGDGPLRNQVILQAINLGIRDRVDFMGPVDDVYPYLSQSKIFVLPSLYEGNPISVLEAMNAKLPIVATKVGGIPDIVVDGKNGFLCKSKDEEGLVEAMRVAYTNKKRREMGEYNHQYVRSFSIENCVDEYLSYFQMILKENGYAKRVEN